MINNGAGLRVYPHHIIRGNLLVFYVSENVLRKYVKIGSAALAHKFVTRPWQTDHQMVAAGEVWKGEKASPFTSLHKTYIL